MRIGLETAMARSLGQRVEQLIRSEWKLGNNSSINHDVIQEMEDRFHTLTAEEQDAGLSQPTWQLVSSFIPNVVNSLSELPPVSKSGKAPVVIGVREAIDVIVEMNSDNKGLYVPAVNIDTGGMASNIAQAVRLQDQYSDFIAMHGTGPIADLHQTLIEAGGIEVRLLKSSKDSYIHPCYLFGEGSSKKEYWMAPFRTPFERDYLDRFTAMVEDACRENSGEPLVLSAIPPPGAGDDYFSRLVDIGEKYNNSTFYNPKQYDDMKNTMISFFNQGKLSFIKPNIAEFVKFLRYSQIIPDTESSEKVILQKLKAQVSHGNLNEILHLAKELICKTNPEMVLIISFSEFGAVAVNSKWAVYIKSPEIKELGCSSGAGDSGLANVLITAKRKNIDLNSTLDQYNLTDLNEGFIDASSGTTRLQGNQIASQSQIIAYKSTYTLNPVVIDLR